MSSAELLATLADLKANRRIPSEVKAAIDPFRGQNVTLKLHFASANRTFGNRFDSSYDDGYTVISKIEDHEIEVSVLFDPSANALIEALSPGETLEAWVTVLDFDDLYQRAILGHLPEERTEEKRDESSTEEVEEEFYAEEPETEDEEPDEVPKKAEEERREFTYPVERKLEDKDREDSTFSTTERKSGPLNLVLAAGGIVAALAAAWGWTNEFTFLASDFARWIFWSILTFPLALGLPSIANRAWKTLLITICAFVFDVAGTYFSTYDSSDPAEVEEIVMEQDDTEVGATYMEEGVVEEFPGKTYYDIAMALQAAAILGLAGSVATKRLGFLSVVAALGFVGYIILFLSDNELVWLQEENFWLNPSFLLLPAITTCCVSITLEAMKPAEEEASSQ